MLGSHEGPRVGQCIGYVLGWVRVRARVGSGSRSVRVPGRVRPGFTFGLGVWCLVRFAPGGWSGGL